MEELKVVQNLGSIEVNFAEIESRIKEMVSQYKGAVFTDDSMTVAKKEVANLRKMKTELDDRRKQVKKEWNKPYDEFETRVKSLQAIIDEPINLINDQVTEFEERRRQEKKAVAVEIFNEMTADLNEFLTLEKNYNPKWENQSYTVANIRSDIKDLVSMVERDIEVLHLQNSECYIKAVEVYRKNLSLGDAMTYIANYERQKAEILKAEEERKHREKMEQIERESKSVQEVSAKEEVVVSKMETVEEMSVVDIPFFAEEEVVFRIPREFTVICTDAEFEQIKMFMDSLGVDYE